jgi:hypothetical protein
MRTGQSIRNRRGIDRLRGTIGLATVGAAMALALFTSPAQGKNYDYSGYTIDQKDAGGYASNNYWNGSGDSKDEGVRNAMRALNCLAALDIGGAFHYGYKGYDNYTNSQRMDDLDSASWSKKGNMDTQAGSLITGSINNAPNTNPSNSDGAAMSGPEEQNAKLLSGKGGASSNSASDITAQAKDHMLSSMDRGFLYRGETGDVAAQFEKKSGMSRETLFNEMAAAEASGLSWDDPNLMDKMEARYQSFIKKIPNESYRKNIEMMHDTLSMAKKTQIFEEAAAFYKEHRWGNGGDKVAQQAADAKAAAEAAASAAGAAGSSTISRELASAEEAPASVIAAREKNDEKPKLAKDQMGLYLGIDGAKGDDLKDLLGQEDTIFRTVSKRYRKLTPMMVGKL